MPRTVPALKIVMIFLLFCAPLFADDTLHQSDFYATFYSQIPPILAITLALITKEIYSSLFVGIISGALFPSTFVIPKSLSTILFGDYIVVVF